MTDEQGQEAPTGLEDLSEGYPNTTEALRAILQEEDLPDGGIRRLELNLFASGEVTWRVHRLDSDEPDGGYLKLGD